jgi:hypothetical protein
MQQERPCFPSVVTGSISYHFTKILIQIILPLLPAPRPPAAYLCQP